MPDIKNRNIESIAIDIAIQIAQKTIFSYRNILKIIFQILLVRLGIKNTIYIKNRENNLALNWAKKFKLENKYRITFSFPAGIQMHRAIGVPDNDNADALSIMKFETKK